MDVEIIAISYGSDRSEVSLRVCNNDGSTMYEEVIFSAPGQEDDALARWADEQKLEERACFKTQPAEGRFPRAMEPRGPLMALHTAPIVFLGDIFAGRVAILGFLRPDFLRLLPHPLRALGDNGALFFVRKFGRLGGRLGTQCS